MPDSTGETNTHLSDLQLSPELAQEADSARTSLFILEMMSARSKNLKPFPALLLKKEACMSSNIDGAEETMEEVLDPTRDETMTANCIKAMEYAIRRMGVAPLDSLLIREIHDVLTQGFPSEVPGEFKPEAAQAMEELVRYINTDDDTDPMIHAGLIHAVFEAIQPFPEENGRLGRILIPLYLKKKQLLSLPVLYMSAYFMKNREEYLDLLEAFREKGDYEPWLKFFLQGVDDTVSDSIDTLIKLESLHKWNQKEVIPQMGRGAKSALTVLGYLDTHPVIEVRSTAKALGIAYSTVSGAVNRLADAEILQLIREEGKSRVFAYTGCLKILDREFGSKK